MASTFADAVTALELIVAEAEDVQLLAALPNQEYDESGKLVDVVDVTFRIFGLPGIFQVHEPQESDWWALAVGDVTRKAALVKLIYDGAADGQSVLQLGPPPEIVPPGVEVPV